MKKIDLVFENALFWSLAFWFLFCLLLFHINGSLQTLTCGHPLNWKNLQVLPSKSGFSSRVNRHIFILNSSRSLNTSAVRFLNRFFMLSWLFTIFILSCSNLILVWKFFPLRILRIPHPFFVLGRLQMLKVCWFLHCLCLGHFLLAGIGSFYLLVSCLLVSLIQQICLWPWLRCFGKVFLCLQQWLIGLCYQLFLLTYLHISYRNYQYSLDCLQNSDFQKIMSSFDQSSVVKVVLLESGLNVQSKILTLNGLFFTSPYI